MHLRLRARATAEGVGVAKIIRDACEFYLANVPPPARHEQIRGRLDLVELLQKEKQIPSAVARMYLHQGRVRLNGKVVREFQIDRPRRKTMELEISDVSDTDAPATAGRARPGGGLR